MPKRNDPPANRQISTEDATKLFELLQKHGVYEPLMKVIEDQETVCFERLRKDYGSILLKDYNTMAVFQANQGVLRGVEMVKRLFSRLAAGSGSPFLMDDEEKF